MRKAGPTLSLDQLATSSLCRQPMAAVKTANESHQLMQNNGEARQQTQHTGGGTQHNTLLIGLSSAWLAWLDTLPGTHHHYTCHHYNQSRITTMCGGGGG